MHTNFTISLAKIISELSLETLYLPCKAEDIMIKSTEINLPSELKDRIIEVIENYVDEKQKELDEI